MADFIDKAKHKAEELAGKAKEHGGKATNDRDLEAEGKGQQTKGGMKQAGDKVEATQQLGGIGVGLDLHVALLAEKAVDERGLADVRIADDRDLHGGSVKHPSAR